MAKDPLKELTEWIRNKLNSLPEKDNQGNNYRVGWQVLTYLVGSAAEESADPKIGMLGKSAKKGAQKSFIDFIAPKLFNMLTNFSNNPYQLTKSCNYCGCVIDNWISYCPYCNNPV